MSKTNEIVRFEFNEHAAVLANPNGPFVRYEDHLAARKEDQETIRELRNALHKLEAKLNWLSCFDGAGITISRELLIELRDIAILNDKALNRKETR